MQNKVVGYSIIDVQLAYIAGIVDGEGCIDTFKSGDRVTYQPRITVVNTNKEVLQFIIAVFGGTVTTRSKVARCKQTYSWTRGGLPAAEILERLLPYFIIKKRHALLAIQLVSCPTSKDYEIVKEISKLNRRGDDEGD